MTHAALAIKQLKDEIVALPPRERARAVEVYAKLQSLVLLEDDAALLAFGLFGMEVEAACNRINARQPAGQGYGGQILRKV